MARPGSASDDKAAKGLRTGHIDIVNNTRPRTVADGGVGSGIVLDKQVLAPPKSSTAEAPAPRTPVDKVSDPAPNPYITDSPVAVPKTSVAVPVPKTSVAVHAQQAPAGCIEPQLGVNACEWIDAMSKSALALRHAQSLSQSAAKAFGQPANIVEALVAKMKRNSNANID